MLEELQVQRGSGYGSRRDPRRIGVRVYLAVDGLMLPRVERAMGHVPLYPVRAGGVGECRLQ